MDLEVDYFKQIASELLLNHVPDRVGKNYQYLNESGRRKGMSFVLSSKNKSPKIYKVQLTLKKGFFMNYLEVYYETQGIKKGFRISKQAANFFEKTYNKHLSDKFLKEEQSKIELLKELIKDSF